MINRVAAEWRAGVAETLLIGGLQVVRDKIVTNCIKEDITLSNYAVKYKTEKAGNCIQEVDSSIHFSSTLSSSFP